MALKGLRVIYDRRSAVDHFMNETGNRGGIVCHKQTGSGDAMDQSLNLVGYQAVASGSRPVGMLLEDMVNNDQTRVHANIYKDEVQQGRKIAVAQGIFVTDQIASGITIVAGEPAYLSNGGRITNSYSTTGGTTASPPVGKFLSKADEDGYAKVEINLPTFVMG